MKPGLPRPSPKPSKPFNWSTLIPRVLLGALTALVVARPLVAGDDPGRLRLTSGGGSLTLNLFTLLLLLGWSIWNGLSRRAADRGALGALGLLMVAGLFFLSAGIAASYQRPGWFMAWDWVIVAALFYLSRQLAAEPGMSEGLFGAVLASAVSLSALAVYQEIATPLDLPSAEQPALEAMPVLVGDEEFAAKLNQPHPPRGHTRGTFDRPETFACFLALVLPVALWMGRMGVRDGSRRGWLAFVCALVVVIALSLTIPGLLATPWSERIRGWETAAKLIGDHPLLGIGPGNFARHSPEGLAGPHSFWLSVAVSAGVVALLVVLGVLARVGWLARSGGYDGQPAPSPSPSLNPSSGPRWEFYLGGVAGLLLGFVLSTGDIPAEAPPSAMLHLGTVAAVRSLIWFAAFALFETVIWSRHVLRAQILLGLGLAGLFGCFSDSLALPTVQWPFWVLAALALNLTSSSNPQSGRDLLFSGWAVAPLALALLIGNVIQAAYPGLGTTYAVREARAASRLLPDQVRAVEGRSGPRQVEAMQQADRFLDAAILEPLRRGARTDPDNAALLLELARWSRGHGDYRLALHEDAAAADVIERIRSWTDRATHLDPRNLAGPLATAEALLLFLDASPVLRKERLAALDKTISAIADRDPSREVPLRYRVVQALLDVVERKVAKPDPEERKQLREALECEAIRLLKLHAEVGRAHGSLSDLQYAGLQARLKAVFPEPTGELKEVLGAKE
jgi:O-Antigen ligase